MATQSGWCVVDQLGRYLRLDVMLPSGGDWVQDVQQATFFATSNDAAKACVDGWGGRVCLEERTLQMWYVWDGNGRFWKVRPRDAGGWVDDFADATYSTTREDAVRVADEVGGYVLAEEVAKRVMRLFDKPAQLVQVEPAKVNEGGWAFARPVSEDRSSGDQPDGNDTIPSQNGMTLRDYFAGQAMSGFLAAHASHSIDLPSADRAAWYCYRYADRLIELKGKPLPTDKAAKG